MRIIKCKQCGESKEEIEFEYLFFDKKYTSICKSCHSEGPYERKTFST